jgi:hypothetical protein
MKHRKYTRIWEGCGFHAARGPRLQENLSGSSLGCPEMLFGRFIPCFKVSPIIRKYNFRAYLSLKSSADFPSNFLEMIGPVD